MSLSYLDSFAFIDQEKLLVDPIFTSDLRAGYFESMGHNFLHHFLAELHQDSHQEFSKLRKFFQLILKSYNENLHYMDSGDDFFWEKVKEIRDSHDSDLQKQFCQYISRIEYLLCVCWGRGQNIRRILGLWNGYDFAEYRSGFSGFSEDANVSNLLRGGIMTNDGDDEKTLGDELRGDIGIIAQRVNELLQKEAIAPNGAILDESVSVFSALDGYSGGEVFLTVDGKIVDAKPPKSKWIDGNKVASNLVIELGDDRILF